MRSLLWARVALLLCLSNIVVAQTTTDPVGDLLSQAVSLWTEATSVLAPAFTQATSAIDAAVTAQSTSSPTSTSSSASSTSSSASSASRTSTSSSASPTSSLVRNTSEKATSTPDGSKDGGHHNNKLGIIIGSVLGAILLLLLVGLLVLCLRRRRRRRSARNMYMSPDESIDDIHAAGLLGAEHPATRHQHSTAYRHDPEVGEVVEPRRPRSPFLPALMTGGTSRRTTPNHRADLLDGPYPEDVPPYSTRNSGLRQSPGVGGTGGALFGAQGQHHHNHNPGITRNGVDGAAERGDLRRHSIARKPVGAPIIPSRSPRRHSADVSDSWGSHERYYDSVGTAY